MIILNSSGTFLSGCLITDTYTTNGIPDSIPSLTENNFGVVSSALEINSTSGGILFPRMTTAQMNLLNVDDGLVIYNTTDNEFKFREGGIWETIGGGVVGYGPGNPTYLQDTNGTTNNLSMGTPAPTFLGQKNTTFGIGAGTYAGTFNNSCFFGYNANPDVDGLTNAVAIGCDAVVSVSNAIILGDATAPTKVGIGTTSPEQILHVANGDAVFAGQVGVGTETPSARLHVADGATYFENSNVGINVSPALEPLHVNGDSIFEGNVGIGTTTPDTPLHVVGKAKFKGITSGGWSGTDIIKGQIGLVDNDSTAVFDFAEPEVGSQLVIKVFISAVIYDEPQESYYSAGAESMCLYIYGPPYLIITNPSVSFSASNPLFFNVTGEWIIDPVDSDLRLQLTASPKPAGDVYYVVSYEYFYSYGYAT